MKKVVYGSLSWFLGKCFNKKKTKFLIYSCIFMYSNTEEKKTTLNDEKTFVIAERNSDFEYSDSTIKDNIYVFEGEYQK